jgi:hypothetical protein
MQNPRKIIVHITTSADGCIGFIPGAFDVAFLSLAARQFEPIPYLLG